MGNTVGVGVGVGIALGLSVGAATLIQVRIHIGVNICTAGVHIVFFLHFLPPFAFLPYRNNLY
jgi:hypothetical protein